LVSVEAWTKAGRVNAKLAGCSSSMSVRVEFLRQAQRLGDLPRLGHLARQRHRHLLVGGQDGAAEVGPRQAGAQGGLADALESQGGQHHSLERELLGPELGDAVGVQGRAGDSGQVEQEAVVLQHHARRPGRRLVADDVDDLAARHGHPPQLDDKLRDADGPVGLGLGPHVYLERQGEAREVSSK
jgi:hypothetical protein